MGWNWEAFFIGLAITGIPGLILNAIVWTKIWKQNRRYR